MREDHLSNIYFPFEKGTQMNSMWNAVNKTNFMKLKIFLIQWKNLMKLQFDFHKKTLKNKICCTSLD